MEMAQVPEAAGGRNNPRGRAGSGGVAGAQAREGGWGPGAEAPAERSQGQPCAGVG